MALSIDESAGPALLETTRVTADRRLRVVHVVPTLREGGAETLVRSLCAELARLPAVANGPALDLQIVSIYDANLSAATRAQLGVPVIEIGRAARRDLAYFPRLVSTLRRLRPDIMHAHLHTGKYAGRFAAILANVPSIVFTEHGDECGGPLRALINRYLHAKTDRFITFTPTQARAFGIAERVSSSKIVVIPNGLQPAAIGDDGLAIRAEIGVAPDAFTIILPARLADQKNQQLALRAMMLARQRGHDDWRLLVVGSGSGEARLRAQAKALDVQGCVMFCGYRDDVRRLLSAVSAFAMPSVWERMPLALGEAMLAGVPIVTTPWAGVEDFVHDGQTGFVAGGWEPADFFAALERAYRDPAGRQRVAAAGRAFASERFDIVRTARRHAELYTDLAGSRPV